MRHDRCVIGLAVLLASGAAIGIANAEPERPVSDKPALDIIESREVVVRSDRGYERFLVERLDVAYAPAKRVNTDMVGKDGVIPAPSDGYALSNRVVVRTTDEPGLRARLEGRNAQVRKLAYAPGFWALTLPTVGAAIETVDHLAGFNTIEEVYLSVGRTMYPTDARPADPGFVAPGIPGTGGTTDYQWHLENTDPGHEHADVNVVPVWCEDLDNGNPSYTGRGVVIGVTECPVEFDHDDLFEQYNADLSNIPDASVEGPHWHATSVAGVCAAREGNGVGGVGVAYGAQFSSLWKVLGRPASPLDDAATFAYCSGPDDPKIEGEEDPWDMCIGMNHIKTNSWGPSLGSFIADAASVSKAAIEHSVLNGRNGLGTVFLWSAGNGGLDARPDYGWYTSNRYSIAVGAIGYQDRRSSYNELGSCMLICAHSNGNQDDGGTWRGITTPTTPPGSTGSSYTNSFGGTSSACPLAAGVVALMLEANPLLTWRDVQHVLVRSARKCDPLHPDWELNGAEHDINYNYGFGAIDAEAAVELARTWVSVGPAPEPVASELFNVETEIPDGDTVGITIPVALTDNNDEAQMLVEAIELKLHIESEFIGDLGISLVSPAGTESIFALRRNDPQSDYGSPPDPKNPDVDTLHTFTTVRCWDEPADGTWMIKIADGSFGDPAILRNYQIVAHVRRPCSGSASDLNKDGFVNGLDVGIFLTLYNAGDLTVDFDENGILNSIDVGLFLEGYIACQL